MLKVKLWSRKRDLQILCAIIVVGLIAWVGYAWAWPEYKWHFQTKPKLLQTLKELDASALHVVENAPAPNWKHSIVVEGIRVLSPIEVSRDSQLSHRVQGETFWLSVVKNYPETPTAEYYAATIGPMTVTPEAVEAAQTTRERELAVAAVEARAAMFSDMEVNGKTVSLNIEGSYLMEGPDTIIAYKVSPTVMMGVVVARDMSDRRDIMIKLQGIDLQTAQTIMQNLRFADPSPSPEPNP